MKVNDLTRPHSSERLLMVMMMMMMAIKNEEELEEGGGDSVSTATHQTLSPSGGVADGDVASSPGCSGISVSAGDPGPCIPGGVEEALRTSVVEPLRDTQEVSITRTPMLETNTNRKSHVMMKREAEEEEDGW